MTKLIIFNKDGTLVNHDRLFIPWLNKLIYNLSPILPKNHKLYEYLGSLNNRFKMNEHNIYGTNEDIKNMIKNYIKQYSSIDDIVLNSVWESTKYNHKNIETHGNLVEIFKVIKGIGIKIAIFTSDNRISTTDMINQTGISNYVDYYLCGDDEGYTKSNGDSIVKICDHLNIDPEESIMVGDTISDIDAGIDAECDKVIAVLSGGYTPQELEDADIIIPDISYIFNYLN